MPRKVIDCRDSPSVSNCTLTIAGEEEELLRAGVLHAVDVHGEKDTPELREMMRRGMRDEAEAPIRAAPARPGAASPAPH